MRRFIIEYANWKMTELNAIEDEKERIEKQRQVTKIAHACDIGFVSIDECMAAIAEI